MQTQTNAPAAFKSTAQGVRGAVAAQSIFPSRTRQSQLLSSLDSVQKQDEARKEAVQENKNTPLLLSLLTNAFSHYRSDSTGWILHPHAECERMRQELSRIEYTQKDVEHFSIALTSVLDWDGFEFVVPCFLSALINAGAHSEYTINTGNLGKTLHLAGCFLESKKLTIQGDVGKDAGYRMSGGELIVTGTARLSPGDLMEGGRITIEGGLEGNFAANPKGGEIHIFGNLPPHGKPIKPFFGIRQIFSSKAKIHHNEKLVFDSGFRGILLYVMHPLMAMQGKLEMW